MGRKREFISFSSQDLEWLPLRNPSGSVDTRSHLPQPLRSTAVASAVEITVDSSSREALTVTAASLTFHLASPSNSSDGL